jgi:hypothetical protein
MGIDLKTIVFPPQQDNTSQLLRQMDYKTNTQKYKQKTGLITSGILDAIHSSGGNTWGISNLITFSYEYTEKPMFTWGLEGSYSGDLENPKDDPATNTYSPELPTRLQAYIDTNDSATFSPAIFIPRIIHWYRRSDLVYSGCYLLIHQINADCTEPDGKLCRIHFRFEGVGYLSKALAGGI